MAKDTHFTWLSDTTWSRTYGTRAAAIIEQGKTYPVTDFPAEVVAEWVKTGHAKMNAAKTAKEE